MNVNIWVKINVFCVHQNVKYVQDQSIVLLAKMDTIYMKLNVSYFHQNVKHVQAHIIVVCCACCVCVLYVCVVYVLCVLYMYVCVYHIHQNSRNETGTDSCAEYKDEKCVKTFPKGRYADKETKTCKPCAP